MLSEEQHILIDRFFSGELTAEETQQFQNMLRDNAAFRAEVELQQQVINGIGAFGASQLKSELQDIHKEVQGELQNYKPSNGGGGLLSAIKWLITLGVLGAVAYYGYKYYTRHQSEILHELNKIEMEEHAPQQSPSGTVRRDTVWHTIKVVGKDTVIYGEKEMQEYMQKNAGKGKLIEVRRDTIKVEEGGRSN